MPRPRASLILALLVLVSAGCGGGGSSSWQFKSENQQVGTDSSPMVGFQSVGGPFGEVIAGVNLPVTVVFSKDVDPLSVTTNSVRLVTIHDASGQTNTPAGVLASYSLEVINERIVISPTVEFTPTSVVYGFVEDALYEISFADATSPDVIKSQSGQSLTNPENTYFFRTPEGAADLNPGFPEAAAYFVDGAFEAVLPEQIDDLNSDGTRVDEVIALLGADEGDNVEPLGGGTKQIPSSPVQDIVFIFDDAVVPSSVFNPADGSSPAIRVLINIPGQFAFQPIIAPASLSFVHQQGNLTVVAWRSDFVAYPPDGLLIVEVSAEVQDLGGNSKSSVTGDNSPELSEPVEIDPGVDGAVYDLTEPFEDQSGKDGATTSADWNPPGADRLEPALAGGRGVDGPLVVDDVATSLDPGETTVPLRAVIDYDAKRVELPVVDDLGGGVFEPHVWELEELSLPAEWTLAVLSDRDADGELDPEEFLVQSASHPLHLRGAPLEILVTGAIDLGGTVEVSPVHGGELDVPTGVSDPDFFDYAAQGGTGGVIAGAGGNGGDGGSVLALRDDGLTATTLVSPFVAAPGLPFDPSDGKLFGATGRSASVSSDTLVDGSQALTGLDDPAIAALIAEGRLLLQPNVGIGSSAPAGKSPNSGSANQAIDENHPSYVVTSINVDGVAGTTTYEVATDSSTSLVQPSKNISVFPFPPFAPIAAGGDSYLLGPLGGADGSDDSDLGRAGLGAGPYVVVNATGIKTAGGGGGGGGGLEAGQDGDDSGQASDPFSNQRGTSFGISRDESEGAAGGLGAIRGTGQVIDGTTFDLLTHTEGADLDALDGADLVGKVLVPNAPDDGWRFTIASVTGGVGQMKTLTLEPVDILSSDIDLVTGPAGVDGPGLTPTEVVPFLILPAFGIGGAGGGGSGVSVTGTLDTSPSALPRLTPGAGAGSGGGAVRLETARSLVIRATGSIQARGGDGGTVPSVQTTQSGAGGGGGGAAEVAAGEGITLFQGALVSVVGGEGGGVLGQGRGGDGGVGWLRFETFDDSLNPILVGGTTEPELTEENFGRLVGEPRSLAQSLFYFTGLANPEIDSLLIRYEADIDGDDAVDPNLTWGFDVTGRDGGTGDLVRPPFRFSFNPAALDNNGFLDVGSAPPRFYDAYDLVSGRTGLAFDPGAGALLYAPGQVATIIHCLSGCGDVALPQFPGGNGFAVDMMSMAKGADRELFLLEQSTGLIRVVDLDSGLLLRTLSLPAVLEGALTFVSDGVDPANDRLVIAANRSDVLAVFPTSDPDAVDPITTDYQLPSPESLHSVSRDGVALDIEITGMAYDVVSDTLWCVDALSGVLFQTSWSAGSRGDSDSTLGHPYVGIQRLGAGVVPSGLAFDGASLHLTVATDSTATSLFTVAPGGLDVAAGVFQGAPLVLSTVPDVPFLPELASPLAAGAPFLRFRMTLDGLFDDALHESGTPVSFRLLSVDEVGLELRNAGF